MSTKLLPLSPHLCSIHNISHHIPSHCNRITAHHVTPSRNPLRDNATVALAPSSRLSRLVQQRTRAQPPAPPLHRERLPLPRNRPLLVDARQQGVSGMDGHLRHAVHGRLQQRRLPSPAGRADPDAAGTRHSPPRHHRPPQLRPGQRAQIRRL